MCVCCHYFVSSLSPPFAIAHVTIADMCSSLKAIEASMDAVPNVGNLRCTTDTNKCLTLDCNYEFDLGVMVPLRLKITLNPCASTPSVNLKLWVQGSRVSAGTYTQSTNTSFSVSGVTTRMAVTATQEIYGVIFGVSLLCPSA